MNLKKKSIITLLGALLLTLTAVFALTACDNGQKKGGHVPVYQGMTIASEVATKSQTHSALGAQGDSGNHYGWYKDKDVDQDEPFGDDSEPIEDVIDSTLEVTGSVAPIYYATPNEDIYINIHFNNPDSYEILSFTLNGEKYSSYMFEYGSNMTNIILKKNVGSKSGIISYTIDAIKYVDGTEIKDVLIDGDKTVKAGVRIPNQVSASVTETMGFNDITLNVNISDKDGLIAYSRGVLKAVLYNGTSLISNKTLNLGNNDVVFSGLNVATLYQYAIVGYYDNLKDGCDWNVLYKNAAYTETPVIFSGVTATTDSVSFGFTWHEKATATAFSSLRLISGGEVRNLSIKDDYVDGLLSYTDYTLAATYTYGGKECEIKYDFKTRGANHNIIYHLNGGENSDENPSTFNEAETVILSGATREDYVFIGWYAEEALDTHVTEIACGTRHDVHLYAKWLYATEGLTYELLDGEYRVTGYTGSSTKIVIPDEWNELPVTSIGRAAFENCGNITSIIIPDSITTIGDWAFALCTSLTTITIPNGITAIGKGTFAYSGLTSLIIPENVTSIGQSAFVNCSALTSVTIGNGVTSIGAAAFNDCSALTSVTIPNSVTSIGDYAFNGCKSLTSVTIPNSVASIGDYALNDCSALSSVTIGNGVTSIGAAAFNNCTALTSITIPNSVTSIGDYAFSKCTSLTSVTIGNGVTSIGDYAFNGCKSLTSVAIPNSVTSIGEGAFDGCSKLTSVTIGNDVTSIGKYAFKGCKSLTSVAIPNSVTSIGKYAFNGCTALTSITIPFVGAKKDGTSDTHFGYILGASSYSENSNYVPSSLKTVIITGGSSIGDYAFSECSRLTSIIIPDSVTSIGERAFEDCTGLISITIPFVGAKKDGKTKTHFGYIFGAPSFEDTPSYVPSSLKTVIVTSASSIGNYAFAYCSNITSTILPNTVTSIGDYAFADCSGLTSIIIPDSVLIIGEGAFSDCRGFTSITIPDSVTAIGELAFLGCRNLVSITIGSSVTSIGRSAFNECFKFTTLYYKGSSTQWSQISIDGENGEITSATLYYYSEDYPYGDTVTEGNFWHYGEDGEIVVWEKNI